MFASLVDRFRFQGEEVTKVIQFTSNLREMLFDPSRPERPGWAVAAVASLGESLPGKSGWQTSDYCGAITRLYSLYEQFVTELVQEYTQLLPRLYSTYDLLPEKTRTQHRVGVGQILQKWGTKGLYRDLTEKGVVSGLADGLCQSPVGYRLLADAFLVDQQNYRAEIVERIFRYLDFEHVMSGAVKQIDMAAFAREHLDEGESVSSLLDEFVEARNAASHSTVTELPSFARVLLYADFLVTLATALSEVCARSVFARAYPEDKRTEIAEVIAIFKKAGANVVGIRGKGIALSVGDVLFAMGPRAARLVTCQSIHMDKTPVDRAELIDGQEVGASFSRPMPPKTRLFRVSVPATR